MTLAFLSLPTGPDAPVAVSPVSPSDSGPSIGCTDRSLMRKIQVTTEPLSEGLGSATLEADGIWRCPVTPTRSLLLGGPADAPLPDGAIDLTCAYAAVELSGPLTNDVLARFCALDVRPHVMPVGAFRPGSVARTPGYVLRTAPDSLLLLVGWALGDYLWTVVADAAGRLGSDA